MVEGAISSFLRAGRARLLGITAALVALIAVIDYSVGNTISLGVLYILPMMVGAPVLPVYGTISLALFCAFLRACFDVPSTSLEVVLRFIFASLAYFMSALFVAALVRNRQLVVESLAKVQREQSLRREAEEQLRVLVESSPAAILTADHGGVILAANNAAAALFSIPTGQNLQGRPITTFLPLLDDALKLDVSGAGFRTAAQCYGRRADGEMFLADTWFSTYRGPDGVRLAAIVVDSSEEMRDREEQGLRQLHRYNRIAAAAVSHEVRNLCGAASLLCNAVGEKHRLIGDEDLQGILGLLQGLEQVVQVDLRSPSHDALEAVPLRSVLDSLRIVIEPGWRESEGLVHWQLPQQLPLVAADPRGLLQAFLNLAQNSHRAVKDSAARQLTVSACAENSGTVEVRFEDSGPGVASPERLFQPFQQGADGSGLGLYISRALLRSYGGDLRLEPASHGACFVVELQTVHE